MIIKTHYKITLDITQKIDRHIQIHSQDCDLLYIYIYIYMGWIRVILHVTLSNVKPPNNLLFNSYFENSTIKLYVLYVLNMHANFHANRM